MSFIYAPSSGTGGNKFTPGRSWDRVDPVISGAGSLFLNQDDMTVQTSSGIAVSAGVAGSGWFHNLPTRLGSDRAGLTMGKAVAESVDLSAYALGAATVACLFYWSGGLGVSDHACLAVVGTNVANRGINIFLKENTGKIDVLVYTGTVVTSAVIVSQINLTVGLHALCVAPIAGNNWRWSLDGSAAATTAMGVAYVAPNTTDQVGFFSRSDALYPLATGQGIDLMVWNSTLSDADLALVSTLPATPTYALPESVSTGACKIRVQAKRFDPSLPAALPARGLSVPLVVSGVKQVGY